MCQSICSINIKNVQMHVQAFLNEMASFEAAGVSDNEKG